MIENLLPYLKVTSIDFVIFVGLNNCLTSDGGKFDGHTKATEYHTMTSLKYCNPFLNWIRKQGWGFQGYLWNSKYILIYFLNCMVLDFLDEGQDQTTID